MRAIKRVLNVKIFFFFKKGLFFFLLFLNSLSFVLCLKPSGVEILPRPLSAHEADAHLAGKCPFVEPSGVPIPIAAHSPRTQPLPGDSRDTPVLIYVLSSQDRVGFFWPTQWSPLAGIAVWLVASYQLPAPKAFFSGTRTSVVASAVSSCPKTKG